jgi:hypothetical protein
MNVDSKMINKNIRELSIGNSLGGLEKKALLCRTGSFDGLYGPVTITEDLLKNISDKYNKDRSKPQNENDYAPILTDHIREVDRIKGRIMADLEVLPWIDPSSGESQMGLFGTLRIDDEEAKDKVSKGQYAHLSITFDEDSHELFEISFVAVEAARRSIVLSKGETQMGTEKRFVQLAQKKNALVKLMTENRSIRGTALSKMIRTKTELENEIAGLSQKMQTISLSIKASQIKGKMSRLVEEGKVNPVELKEIDFTELALLPEKSLKVVLSSYEKRAVSTDVFQYGQSGKNEIKVSALGSPEKMRKAIELQKSGHTLSEEEKQSLTEEDNKPAPKEEMKSSYAMGEEEWKQCLEDIGGIHTKLSEVIEKVKAMGGEAEKLASVDKEQEDEEKKLAVEEPEEKEGDK